MRKIPPVSHRPKESYPHCLTSQEPSRPMKPSSFLLAPAICSTGTCWFSMHTPTRCMWWISKETEVEDPAFCQPTTICCKTYRCLNKGHVGQPQVVKHKHDKELRCHVTMYPDFH